MSLCLLQLLAAYLCQLFWPPTYVVMSSGLAAESDDSMQQVPSPVHSNDSSEDAWNSYLHFNEASKSSTSGGNSTHMDAAGVDANSLQDQPTSVASVCASSENFIDNIFGQISSRTKAASSTSTSSSVAQAIVSDNMSITDQLAFHKAALASIQNQMSVKRRGRPNIRLQAERETEMEEHRSAISSLQASLPDEIHQLAIVVSESPPDAWRILANQKPNVKSSQCTSFVKLGQECHVKQALELVQNGTVAQDNFDEDVIKLWSVLSSTAHKTQKLETIADLAGIDRRRINNILRLLGSTLEYLSRLSRAQLEDLIGGNVAPGHRIQYLDMRSYDETPLWLTQIMNLSKIGSPGLGDQGNNDDNTALVLESTVQQLRIPASPVKVVVFRAGYSMLLRIKNKFISITGRTSTKLRSAKSLTGPTMGMLALQSSAATPVANSFKSKGSGVLTDKHASNIQGERLIHSEYRPGWFLHHRYCEVHAQAGLHKDAFGLEVGFTSGVYHIGLQHRSMTYHDIFVQCCMEEVDALMDVVIVDSYPELDLDALMFKKFCLRCFCSRGSNIELRKALLVRSLPLDWRSDRIIFPVLRCVGPVPEHIVRQSVKHGVKLALFGRRCPIYNTSDWTHADLSLDWIGCAEAPYNLYSRTQARFYKVMQDKKSLLTLENTCPAAAEPLLPIQGPDPGMGSSEGETSKDGDAQRKQTAKSIFEASKFADRESLLGRVMRGRILMEGLREGMSDRLVVGSRPWERKQQAEVAKAIKSGNLTYKRQYPMTVAATMAHEEQLVKRLRYIGENETMWQQVPNASRTVAFRCTSFRMSSRCGCACEWHFNRLHRLPPFPLFLKLTDTPNAIHIAQQAAWECKDINDSITSELLKDFPNLTGEECDARLEHIAQNTLTNTSANEILNGRLRKEAVSKVNTHKVSVPDLGAMWLIRESKDDKPVTMDRLTHEGSGQVASNMSKPRPYRKKRVRHLKVLKPSLARMFFRVVSAGKKGVTRPSAVWSLYRQLREESPGDERLQEAQRMLEAERLSLQRAAAAGIQLEPKQKPSKLRRALQVKLRRANVTQIIDRCADDQRPLAIADSIRGAKGNHSDAKTMARICQQELSKRRKLIVSEDDSAMQQYSDSVGKGLVEELAQTGLVPSSGLVSVPSTGAVQTFWYNEETEIKQTGQVASSLAKAQTSGVSKQIKEAFIEAHQPERTDAKMIAGVGRLTKIPECMKAGMCVCKPSTRHRLHFRNSVYSVLKSHFRPGTPNRSMLSDGYIIVKLTGQDNVTDDETCCYGHIGFALLSPYRMSFQSLVVQPDPGELAPRPGRLYFGASYNYSYDFKFFEELKKDNVSWAISFFSLESTEEVVEHLKPSPVPALPLFGGKAYPIWSGKGRQTSDASKVDLEEVSKAMDRIVECHEAGQAGSGDAAASSVDVGELEGEVDAIEPGTDDKGDSVEPSELDKLIAEARDEDIANDDDESVGGVDAAGDADDLLQDISSGLADGGNDDGEVPAGPSGSAGEGASSSSTDAPPLPPPAAPLPKMGEASRTSTGALATVELEGGYIGYYQKGVFEAVCRKHNSCVVSRTVSAKQDKSLGRPKGGRPLGVMAAWLSKHSECASKEDHWQYHNFLCGHDERMLHRLDLQGTAAGRRLLSFERPQSAVEPSPEPDDHDVWEYMPKSWRS